ncbi:MAG: hypothetical protein Q8P56_02805 [Candidatus Uhrbacteria bacterium]|nr:hypothetical protein [Candidatus Uhrbacteria bacterium]
MKRSLPATFLFWSLIGCNIFLIIAHIFLRQSLGFFDLDKEGSLKAVISGFQLLALGFGSGFVTFLVSRLRASRPYVMLWACVSALFFYLAMDDIMMIHERIGFVLNRWTGLHGTFESFNWLLYFAPLIVLGSCVLILIVRSLWHIDRHAGIFSSVGVSGFFGTIGIEAIGKQLLAMGALPAYQLSIILEESILLFGETFFLIGLFLALMVLFSRAYIRQDQSALPQATITSLVRIPHCDWGDLKTNG